MNVNGMPPALARLVATAAAAAPRTAEPRLEKTSALERVVDAGGLDASIDAASSAIRPAALRAASLWEMLTPEERAFFSEPATLGALTYRPGGGTAPATAGPTGQRVDFKA